MDIIIKVSDINGAVISEFIAIARYHKGRYFADENYCRYSRLDFDTTGDSFITMVYIKIMMKIDLLIRVKVGQGIKLLFYSGYSRRLFSKSCH
jgi:hypothetical protein